MSNKNHMCWTMFSPFPADLVKLKQAAFSVNLTPVALASRRLLHDNQSNSSKPLARICVRVHYLFINNLFSLPICAITCEQSFISSVQLKRMRNTICASLSRWVHAWKQRLRWNERVQQRVSSEDTDK